MSTSKASAAALELKEASAAYEAAIQRVRAAQKAYNEEKLAELGIVVGATVVRRLSDSRRFVVSGGDGVALDKPILYGYPVDGLGAPAERPEYLGDRWIVERGTIQ